MFEKARLKLTFWYLITIMAVSTFFSLIVYRGFAKELGRGFRFQNLRTPPEKRIHLQIKNGFIRILPFIIYPEETPPEEFAEIINLAKKRFAIQLLIINAGILVLAGTAGYFLAGKTLQPIESMVEEQKRFVADASHEFRTPLASMKAEVEVALREKKLSLKEAKQRLKSILEEVDRMKHLTDNLLSLSRYEKNGSNLEKERIDLSKLAREIIEKNKKFAKTKKIAIKSSLAKEVFTEGNPQSLTELISILLDNAIKYSNEKSQVWIKTYTKPAKPKGKKAVIEVSDQGVGIPPKDLPHIFDRFYRVESSRTKKGPDGYGLGLSIAKSIVELHNGNIKVKSELGKGSAFKISLPA